MRVGRLITALVLGAGIVVGAVYMQTQQPQVFESVEAKIRSVLHMEGLTPARDLRGTWASSLSGKGIRMYGEGHGTQGGTVKVYDDADFVLRIDSVEGNVARGAARMFNETLYGEVTGVPMVGTIPIPRQTPPDTGFQPVTIRVEGSSLVFETVSVGGISVGMNGTFVEDNLVGWGGGGNATMAGYGGVVVKVEMNLTRCSSRWHGTGCPAD